MARLDNSDRYIFRNATPRNGLIGRKVRDEDAVLSPEQMNNHALSDFFIWGLGGRKDQADSRTIITQEFETPHFKIENVFATYRKTVSTYKDIFHPGIHLTFLLKAGNFIQFVPGTKTLLRKDNIYLFSIPAQGCLFKIKPGEYRFVILTLENELIDKLSRDYQFFGDILSKYQSSLASLVFCEANMQIIQVIEKVGLNMKQRESVNQFHIEANCMQILSFAIERIAQSSIKTAIHHIDEILQLTIQFIDTNYYKPNILDELTGLGMEEELIKAAMFQQYGISLDDFIKTIRLRKAYELLNGGVFIVSEIAEIIGYTDKEKFESDFKEYNQQSAHSLLSRSQKK